MASIRVKSDSEPQEMTTLYAFSKSEGWFVLNEIELPKDLVLKNAKVVSKTEPDIFPIFIEHLIKAAKNYYGI